MTGDPPKPVVRTVAVSPELEFEDARTTYAVPLVSVKLVVVAVVPDATLAEAVWANV